MTTQNQHTPTPWIAGKFSSIVGCPIINSQGNVIADTKFQGKDKAEANAAFIVRACNEYASMRLAHEELLTALKAAQQHLEYCNYGDSWERQGVYEPDGVATKIDAAIAKAEGK